jgi:hypothetical protein
LFVVWLAPAGFLYQKWIAENCTMLMIATAQRARNRRLRFELLEDRRLLAAVASFTLINADTDVPLGPLAHGQTINLAQLPTANVNIRADTAEPIGSIRFDFDGQLSFRIENTGPYALFGDTDGNYRAGSLSVGNHMLAATPFSQRNANGTAGSPLSIEFTVINESSPTNQPPIVSAGSDQSITFPTILANLDGTVVDDSFPSNPLTLRWEALSGPGTVTFADAASVDTVATFGASGTYVLRLTADDGLFVRSDEVQVTVNPQHAGPGVASFTLINAITDQPMFALSEGMIIDLAQLETAQVNVRANINGTVGSIAFDFDGTTNKRIDSVVPYALFSETSGDYKSVVLGLGKHTLTGRAFTGSSGGGSVLNSLTLHFQVAVFSPAPDQIHLSWTDDPSTSLTVVWRTFDATSASTVQYRRLGDSTWLKATGVQKPSGTTGILREATIRGLLSSTQYEYRVLGDGDAWSTVHVTATAPVPGAANFDFVYLADTGLIGRADGLSTGTQQIIDDVANLNPLLVLGGGDYAYYNTDKRFGPLDAHIDAWFNQSAPFLTRSVFMPTFGNHEVRLKETYDSWIERMALPASHTDNFRVYSFDVGHVHFVSILAVLGTMGIPQPQVDWIIQDVTSARARGQTWIIPYMHVSAFADGASHPSNVTLRNQLGPVFEQLGVHLVISSHDQNYERTYPLVNVGQGSPIVTDTSLTGYDADDGIVWLKVSPAGKLSSIDSDFSTFQTNPPPYWNAARDDTMHHFVRFQVSADGMLTVEILATPGNGTPSFVHDMFTYSLGTAVPAYVVMTGDSDHNVAVNEGDYDVWLKSYDFAALSSSFATFNNGAAKSSTQFGPMNSAPRMQLRNVVPISTDELALLAHALKLEGHSGRCPAVDSQENQIENRISVQTRLQKPAKELAFEWFDAADRWWQL